MKTSVKIALISLLTAIMPMQALAATFTDVGASSANYLAIEYLVHTGTLQGYDDSTFKPEQTINRAELMKVLVAGQGIDPDSSTYQNCFPDVATDWFAKYVCYAKEQKWVDGYSDNTFKPAQTVNRAEAVKMIVNAYSLPTIGEPNSPFSDVSSSDWFFGYITSLEEKDIIDGGSSTYSPSSGMTRGLTAEYIFRVLIAKANEDLMYSEAHREAFLTTVGLSELLAGAPYIKSVFYDGQVAQVESDEYVEIGNNGAGSINLEGYSIMGSKGNEKYTFPSVDLAPGETLKVYTNQGDYSFGSEDAVWSNDGETVTLYDVNGKMVDEYTY